MSGGFPEDYDRALSLNLEVKLWHIVHIHINGNLLTGLFYTKVLEGQLQHKCPNGSYMLFGINHREKYEKNSIFLF